jgi:hypothetical protein
MITRIDRLGVALPPPSEPDPAGAAATKPHSGEPWPGYDSLTAAEIKAVLAEDDTERAQRVRAYECMHKNRSGVLHAAGRRHSQV